MRSVCRINRREIISILVAAFAILVRKKGEDGRLAAACRCAVVHMVPPGVAPARFDAKTQHRCWHCGNHYLGSSPATQAEFVEGVFDAWESSPNRVPFLNYFMLHDFPERFARELAGYYGIEDDRSRFVAFISLLGLHPLSGTPRPGWDVLRERASRFLESATR